MFAPSINTTMNRLTDGYTSIQSLDGFSATVNNLAVVKLDPDPDWLPPVRVELGTLRTDAGKWFDVRSDIWAPVLVNFYNYTSIFEAFVSTASKTKLSSAKWQQLLNDALLPELDQCVTSARTSVSQMESARAAFSAVLPMIDKSIQQGWSAMGSEEQDMLKLSEEIGNLHAIAQSYSAKLTSDVISGGKSYVQSTISLIYAAVAAGAAATIPILGIASAVFAIGKSFYDIIEDNQQLIDTMNRIAELQQQLSADAVRLALTKATLQVLYQLEETYLASKDALPALVDLWELEQTKVQDAINALAAGLTPRCTWTCSPSSRPRPTGPRSPASCRSCSRSMCRWGRLSRSTSHTARSCSKPPSCDPHTCLNHGKELTMLLATDPNDPTPAPDNMEGKTGQAFNAAQLITIACQNVANTAFSWPSEAGPKPDWFDDLNTKLGVAQSVANEWLDTLGTKVTKTIPLQVLNFQPTFDAVTGNILQIVQDHGGESGATNPYVLEIKQMIQQGLLPQIEQTLGEIDGVAQDLVSWGQRLQAAHNDLVTGATNIQALETHLQGDIDAMNNAIANLHTYIDNENKAIAASAAAIGIGIFALVVGIALAPETGGASLVIGGFIGTAGIIGGAVTWGIMQHKIDEQFAEIAKDQAEKEADQRAIVALQGLGTASSGAISNMELAQGALSKLKTQWGVFGGELQGVVDKLDQAEQSISVIMQGVFTEAAQKEWAEAAVTANALANFQMQVDAHQASMNTQQTAEAA